MFPKTTPLYEFAQIENGLGFGDPEIDFAQSGRRIVHIFKHAYKVMYYVNAS